MNDTQKRIEEIRDRIEWMNENYSGCDWCCGGGDEEMGYLMNELHRLESEELNPCRCGGEPLISLDFDSGQAWCVTCCKCGHDVHANTKLEAMEKWCLSHPI